MRVVILVKDIRNRKKLTLGQLAERTGISKSHISDVENENKEPGISVMVRLAKALDVEITELYKVIW